MEQFVCELLMKLLRYEASIEKGLFFKLPASSYVSKDRRL